jgi:DNA polymerase-3 subunit delta
MADVVAGLDFLADPALPPEARLAVFYGEDFFLIRQSVLELRRRLLPDEDAEFSLSRFDGPSARWSDVMDELATISMFAPLRLVVVESADEFVTQNRPSLERFAGKSQGTSVLALALKQWRPDTNLGKAALAKGLVVNCQPPAEFRLRAWLKSWCKSKYQASIDAEAVARLLEIVGPETGLLDQELAKLAAAAPKRAIAAALVEELVGGWRVKTIWAMLDRALAGKPGEALDELDRLLAVGEPPIALLAALSTSLRKMAHAARIVERVRLKGGSISVKEALEEAGVKSQFLGKTEADLRRLGRVRAGSLYRRLLECDLSLKGASQLAPRLVLEELVIELARPVRA